MSEGYVNSTCPICSRISSNTKKIAVSGMIHKRGLCTHQC
jgi:hypothetical protein